MELNKLQKKAYDLALSPEMKGKILFLTGAGGVGKTYTISKIAEDYCGEVMGTALSHKATKVMKNMGIKHIATIHSFLGFIMKQSGYNMVLRKLSNPVEKRTGLLLVDEVSMLSTPLYDAIVEKLNRGHVERVILIGDALQLPAVSGGMDLHKLGLDTVELTQQMRQDPKKLEIATFLESIRNSINSRELSLDDTPDDIVVCETFREFAKAYQETDDEKMILAFQNKTVDSYNNNIKHGDDVITRGELVVLDKPIRNHFKNQDIVTIESVQEEEDRFVFTLESVQYDMYHYKSQRAENDALQPYVDEGDEVGYWELKDKCFKLKHVYAQSIHKSQGSSYGTVFLDFTDLHNAYTKDKTQWSHPISYDMYVRLLYVAISRMVNKCYLYIGDKRDYKDLKRNLK